MASITPTRPQARQDARPFPSFVLSGAIPSTYVLFCTPQGPHSLRPRWAFLSILQAILL